MHMERIRFSLDCLYIKNKTRTINKSMTCFSLAFLCFLDVFQVVNKVQFKGRNLPLNNQIVTKSKFFLLQR